MIGATPSVGFVTQALRADSRTASDRRHSEWTQALRAIARRDWALLACELFARRRKRPGNLEPAFLTEVEAHLTRRPQPLRPVWPERRARAALSHRAEHVLLEEAAIARNLPTLWTHIRHPNQTPLALGTLPGRLRSRDPAARLHSRRQPSKRVNPPGANRIPGKRNTFVTFLISLLIAGISSSAG